jgi:NAD(P)-dependent dehydrogenase (short-subunit alcohol dehydrogenase family)
LQSGQIDLPVSAVVMSLAGKQAVVVGGTAGIGRGVAVRLARAGCAVTIVGRSESRGARVIAEMEAAAAAAADGEEKTAASTPSSFFFFVRCDCFLLKNVAACVGTLKSKHPRLDYLICTQGMATLQGFTPSQDEGLDQKLTLHVYSRAMFARGLKENLGASTDGRFLTVLSAGIHAPFKDYAADPELSKGGYSIKNAADIAGFYSDIFVDAFSRKYGSTGNGVSFLHAAPGFVATAWGTEMPGPIRGCVRCLQCCMGRSRNACGDYMVRALTHPGYSRSADSIEFGNGTSFFLIDEYGNNKQKVTALHEEAREQVAAGIEAVLDAGKSVVAT